MTDPPAFDWDSVSGAAEVQYADDFVEFELESLAEHMPLRPEELPDDLEGWQAEEIRQTISGFRERAGKEADRHDLATAADVWLCICFPTNEQLLAYLKGMGWHGIAHRFVDGRKLAAEAGITLPPDPEWKPLPTPARALAELAAGLGDEDGEEVT